MTKDKSSAFDLGMLARRKRRLEEHNRAVPKDLLKPLKPATNPVGGPCTKEDGGALLKGNLRAAFKYANKYLKPEAMIYQGFIAMRGLLLNHFKYMEFMDKKMAKVTKAIKTGERDIKEGKAGAAVKALEGAKKKNVKLTKEDRDVRDPLIERCKKAMKGSSRSHSVKK